MAYAAGNVQGYQNNQQLMLIAFTIFGSIIAAVVVSTMVVMSLMRGEIASAVSGANPSTPTTQTIAADPGLCTQPTKSAPTSASTGAPSSNGSGSAASVVYLTSPSAVNSFNNTNSSTSNVVNKTTETNTTNTTISDSYNHGSYNQVASNNTLNSNNTVDSNNTTIASNNDFNSHNTTIASNNTVNSNNPVTNVNSNNKLKVDSHDVNTVVRDNLILFDDINVRH